MVNVIFLTNALKELKCDTKQNDNESRWGKCKLKDEKAQIY